MGVNGIYGLSGSGLDIESLVKVGMMSKQSEYDKMYKKETKQEWTKSAYNDFYSSMMTYRYTTLSTYKMESNMNAMGATSSDTKVATVSANGEAAAMSHNVTVTDMVTNPYLQTKDKITRSGTDQTSIYLKDILGKTMTYTAGSDDDSSTVTVDGTSHKATDVAMSFVVGDTATTTYTTTFPTGYTTTTSGSSTAYTATATTTDGTNSYTTTYTYNSDNTISATTADASGNSYTTAFKASGTISSVDDFTSAIKSGTTTVTIGGNDIALSSSGTGIANKGKTIVYTYKDLYEKSLNDLASDLKNAGTNISASYDSVNDSFSIYNKNGGSKSKIHIEAFTGTYTDSTGTEIKGADASSDATTNFYSLINNLGLAAYDGSSLGDTIKLEAGKTTAINTSGTDGSITVDGKTYDSLTSNKVTVAGVTYSLLSKGTSTVTVTQDTDAIVKNVKQFVTDYNKLLDSMNDKINETANSDYEPLTKTEKDAMSEDEVTAWEKKAKSGLLYHDKILKNITSKMREALYTPVDSITSNYNSASAIGISSSTDQGHLTLDENKLKKALEADPDCVYQIFASSKEDKDGNEDTANTGIANRLDTVMKAAITQVSNQAGTSTTTDDQSYLGLLITNLKTKMDDFSDEMDTYRDNLYKKYDAMETALSSLNTQYSYISSSFS